MNRPALFTTLLLISFVANGQSVTGLNFNYWYNPLNEVDLQMKLSRGTNQLVIHYALKSLSNPIEKYSITWEKRNSYSTREAVPVTEKDSILSALPNQEMGVMKFGIPTKPWILLAKVTNNETLKSWYYFKLMEAIFPSTGWVENNGVVMENYLIRGHTYTIKSVDDKPLHVSFYGTSFSQPYPPFSEKTGPTDQFLFHDSTFHLNSGSPFTPVHNGLYLFQQDTTAAEGFAVRVANENFPKFAKIEELTAPLIFVTTQDEFKQLVLAKGDKPKVDKVILDITRDKDRAKNFMRSYFQRIELANRYFGSFKEGWKTDRGMIYTIFGVPDELAKNGGNEIWYYKNSGTRFTFVKSGSIYDPENYVLLRDKRFTETWFSTIDLWRKSRF